MGAAMTNDDAGQVVRPVTLVMRREVLQLRARSPIRKHADELSDARHTGQIAEFFFIDARRQLDRSPGVARQRLGSMLIHQLAFDRTNLLWIVH